MAYNAEHARKTRTVQNDHQDKYENAYNEDTRAYEKPQNHYDSKQISDENHP
jgi:hypothetical protein